MNEGVNRVLLNFGITLKKDLQKSLVKKGREKAARYGSVANDNTTLGDSIRPDIVESDDGLTFNLHLNDYYKWVDGGRGATKKGGSGELKKSLKEWIRRKGINPITFMKDLETKSRKPLVLAVKARKRNATVPRKPVDQLTFPEALAGMTAIVARNIHLRGFKGNKFFTSVLQDGRLKKLEEDLKKETGKQIRIILNGGNNS